MFLPHNLKSLVTIILNRNRQQGSFKVLKSNIKYIIRMNNDLKMLQQSINKEIVIKKKNIINNNNRNCKKL